MFFKTTALSASVTSGSTTTGDVIDISGYSKIFVESAVSGTIAGTGSLRITSISQEDLNPASGIVTEPAFTIGQPAAATVSGNGGSGWSYASASILSIDAKWARMSWSETSGSVSGSGSVILKVSLLT
jgi:hypothetical protein